MGIHPAGHQFKEPSALAGPSDCHACMPRSLWRERERERERERARALTSLQPPRADLMPGSEGQDHRVRTRMRPYIL